jgi:hypothetical protein
MLTNIREYIDRLFAKKPTLRRIPGRFKVRDGASPNVIAYRMGGFFPGSVTRTHPQWIEPCLVHPSATPPVPGAPIMLHQSDNSVLMADATFVSGALYGIAVRAYPTQPFVINPAGTQTVAPPVVDVMREGYIAVACVGAPLKGGSVYLLNGVFQAASTGGAVLVTNAKFNGPPDAQGNAEVIINVGQP